MNLKQFREQYPQYNDWSDQELAEGLYDKYYKDDLTWENYAAQIEAPHLVDTGDETEKRQKRDVTPTNILSEAQIEHAKVYAPLESDNIVTVQNYLRGIAREHGPEKAQEYLEYAKSHHQDKIRAANLEAFGKEFYETFPPETDHERFKLRPKKRHKGERTGEFLERRESELKGAISRIVRGSEIFQTYIYDTLKGLGADPNFERVDRDWNEKFQPVIEKWKDDIDSGLRPPNDLDAVVGALTQMAPYSLGIFGAGGPGALGIGAYTLGTIGMMIAADSYDQLLAMGVSQERARSLALKDAMVQGGIESLTQWIAFGKLIKGAWTNSRILGRMSRAGRIKPARLQVNLKTGRTLAQLKPGSKLTRFLKTVGMWGGGVGLEISEEIAQEMWQSALHEYARFELSGKEFTSGDVARVWEQKLQDPDFWYQMRITAGAIGLLGGLPVAFHGAMGVAEKGLTKAQKWALKDKLYNEAVKRQKELDEIWAKIEESDIDQTEKDKIRGQINAIKEADEKIINGANEIPETVEDLLEQEQKKYEEIAKSPKDIYEEKLQEYAKREDVDIAAEKKQGERFVDPVTGKNYNAPQLMARLKKEGKPTMGEEFSRRRGYTEEQIKHFNETKRYLYEEVIPAGKEAGLTKEEVIGEAQVRMHDRQQEKKKLTPKKKLKAQAKKKKEVKPVPKKVLKYKKGERTRTEKEILEGKKITKREPPPEVERQDIPPVGEEVADTGDWTERVPAEGKKKVALDPRPERYQKTKLVKPRGQERHDDGVGSIFTRVDEYVNTGRQDVLSKTDDASEASKALGIELIDKFEREASQGKWKYQFLLDEVIKLSPRIRFIVANPHGSTWNAPEHLDMLGTHQGEYHDGILAAQRIFINPHLLGIAYNWYEALDGVMVHELLHGLYKLKVDNVKSAANQAFYNKVANIWASVPERDKARFKGWANEYVGKELGDKAAQDQWKSYDDNQKHRRKIWHQILYQIENTPPQDYRWEELLAYALSEPLIMADLYGVKSTRETSLKRDSIGRRIVKTMLEFLMPELATQKKQTIMDDLLDVHNDFAEGLKTEYPTKPGFGIWEEHQNSLDIRGHKGFPKGSKTLQAAFYSPRLNKIGASPLGHWAITHLEDGTKLATQRGLTDGFAAVDKNNKPLKFYTREEAGALVDPNRRVIDPDSGAMAAEELKWIDINNMSGGPIIRRRGGKRTIVGRTQEQVRKRKKLTPADLALLEARKAARGGKSLVEVWAEKRKKTQKEVEDIRRKQTREDAKIPVKDDRWKTDRASDNLVNLTDGALEKEYSRVLNEVKEMLEAGHGDKSPRLNYYRLRKDAIELLQEKRYRQRVSKQRKAQTELQKKAGATEKANIRFYKAEYKRAIRIDAPYSAVQFAKNKLIDLMGPDEFYKWSGETPPVIKHRKEKEAKRAKKVIAEKPLKEGEPKVKVIEPFTEKDARKAGEKFIKADTPQEARDRFDEVMSHMRVNYLAKNRPISPKYAEGITKVIAQAKEMGVVDEIEFNNVVDELAKAMTGKGSSFEDEYSGVGPSNIQAFFDRHAQRKVQFDAYYAPSDGYIPSGYSFTITDPDSPAYGGSFVVGELSGRAIRARIKEAEAMFDKALDIMAHRIFQQFSKSLRKAEKEAAAYVLTISETFRNMSDADYKKFAASKWVLTDKTKEEYAQNIERQLEEHFEYGATPEFIAEIASDQLSVLNMVFDQDYIKNMLERNRVKVDTIDEASGKEPVRHEYKKPEMEEDAKRGEKGIKKSTFLEKGKSLVIALRNSLREFEYLPRKKHGDVQYLLRRLKKSQSRSARAAQTKLKEVISNLDRRRFHNLQRFAYIMDMREQVDMNEKARAKGLEPKVKANPYGWTDADIKREAAELFKIVKGDDLTWAAWKARQETWLELRKAYKVAMKNVGFDVSKRLERAYYFRHQVLDLMELEHQRYGIKGSVKLAVPTRRSHLRQRAAQTGYAMNLNFIQAEFEVMAQLLYDTEIAEVLNEVMTRHGSPEQLEGYELYSPREDTIFYMVNSIPARLAQEAIQSGAKELKVPTDKINEVLALGGRYKGWYLPSDVAKTLNEALKPRREYGLLGQTVSGIMTGWKAWQLIMPLRLLKYNIRNMTGDAEAVFLGSPGVFKWAPRSFAELYNWKIKGEISADLQDYIDLGGLETTMQAQELWQILEQPEFRHVMDRGRSELERLNIFKKVWKKSRQMTDLREISLRYAAYLKFKNELDNNNGKPKHYVASLPEEVDALTTNKDKAFMMSNDLLGAYDRISIAGEGLRKYIAPFWSFQEINIKRTIVMFRNAINSDQAAQNVGYFLGAKGAVAALKVGKLALKFMAFSMALQLWNQWVMGDCEDALPDEMRRRSHVILRCTGGENPEVVYFPRIGVVGDLLEWMGADTAPSDIRDMITGEKDFKDVVDSYKYGKENVKDVLNKMVQSTGPWIKMPGEAIGATKWFPNIWNKQPITDYVKWFAESFALGAVYDGFTGKPTHREHWKRLAKRTATYREDRKRLGWLAIQQKVNEYKQEAGLKGRGFIVTDTGNALYNLGLAWRYGDLDAQTKYFNEYIEAVLRKYGDPKAGPAIEKQWEKLKPLADLPELHRKIFVTKLNEREQYALGLAFAYYAEIKAGTQFLRGKD